MTYLIMNLLSQKNTFKLITSQLYCHNTMIKQNSQKAIAQDGPN